METDASNEAVWRAYERFKRFGSLHGEDATSATPTEEALAANPLLAAASADALASFSFRLNVEEQETLFVQSFVLVEPLGAALQILRKRAEQSGNREAPDLGAATREEMSFYYGLDRLGVRGDVLCRERRWQELAREFALDVALDLAARAMETWYIWSTTVSMRGVTAEDRYIVPFDMPSHDPGAEYAVSEFERNFAMASQAVHLGLRCAMQDRMPLPGSWLNATMVLHFWGKLERSTARSALVRNSPSFCAVRALLAEGGPALQFLRDTEQYKNDAGCGGVPLQDPVLPVLRRCSAPGCAEEETIAGVFKICALCRQASYCCKTCQVAHWKAGHKRECAGRKGTK